MAESSYVRKGVTSSNFSLENEKMYILNGGKTDNTQVREDG